MTPSLVHRSLLPLVLAVLAAACTGRSEAEGASAAELPLLALSEPLLEIGVLDGPDEYVFAMIESVVRLGDGRIAVSDAGASHISLYDADGTFLRRWGRRGDGPEEFRSLGRLYPHGSDSLMVSERYPARMSVFDLDGSLGRRFPAVELTQDTLFALDSWLYGRFWIDGALLPDARAGVRAAIREIASAQEIHYASHGSYTSDVDALERFESPEGIGVDFAGGTARGWAAVFTHPAVDRVCGLAYGFDHPPGWTPGMVVCGPYAATATAGES